METITAVYPSRTKSISVTGEYCELNCSHCGRKYLKHMENISDTLAKGKRQYTSALISGGLNDRGYVSIEKHIRSIEILKTWGWKINAHTGLMPASAMEKTASAADRISLDFIYDRETIEKVYRVDFSPSQYLKTIEEVRKFKEPDIHLTIGLFGGEIKGEFKAIDVLSKINAKNLIFLVLTPTKGTAFEKCSPPKITDVEKTIALAREKLPSSKLSIGCMHPRGKYADDLGLICLKHKLNQIVMPGRNFEKMALQYNTNVIIKRECCVL